MKTKFTGTIEEVVQRNTARINETQESITRLLGHLLKMARPHPVEIISRMALFCAVGALIGHGCSSSDKQELQEGYIELLEERVMLLEDTGWVPNIE